MNNYFKKRSMYSFAAVIFGFVLVINLHKLSFSITDQVILYPYTVSMLLASCLGLIGYILINVRFLGASSVLWIISLVLNVAAIIFIVPIIILNIIGRNKIIDRNVVMEEGK